MYNLLQYKNGNAMFNVYQDKLVNIINKINFVISACLRTFQTGRKRVLSLIVF